MKQRIRKTGQALRLSAALAALTFCALGASAQVFMQKIGNPTWRPADTHQFTTRLGDENDGFAGFGQTMAALLPEPYHVWVDGLGLGPGAPHPGPYDEEFATGVERLGVKDAVTFSLAQTELPNGIFQLVMLVPADNAPAGSSPDFANGPIIPNSICPIHVSLDDYMDRRLVGVNDLSFDVPSLNAIPTPYNVDGHSHIPLFFASFGYFEPGQTPPASFAKMFHLRDVNGNGWDVTFRFRIVPSQRP
jgi:hypothetical protein